VSKVPGSMRIISFIKEFDIIEDNIAQFGSWDIHNHDPPEKGSDHILEFGLRVTTITVISWEFSMALVFCSM